jgi:phosphoribosylformylglycinamidine synthase
MLGNRPLGGESMSVQTLVLRVDGTNCDVELVEAFRQAGSQTERIHINQLIRGKYSLEAFHILAIPGGFSYGDDVAAGKLLANDLKYRLRKDVEKFIDQSKPILGICNGFQALVKAGFLPALDQRREQQATLATNDSALFIDRWVYLKQENRGRCIFTTALAKQMYVPVNHGEGKFVMDIPGIQRLEENDQIVFRYVNPEGKLAGYPWNPNGSISNIAGICDEHGTILGLMPHPEKFIHPYQHPFWSRFSNSAELKGWLPLFQNAVDYARRRFL